MACRRALKPSAPFPTRRSPDLTPAADDLSCGRGRSARRAAPGHYRRGLAPLPAGRMAHFIDEPRPQRRQRARTGQGRDRVAGVIAAMHESLPGRLGRLAGCNVLARAPEVSNRQVRIGAAQKSFERTFALSPRGVEEAVVGLVIKVIEVENRAEL